MRSPPFRVMLQPMAKAAPLKAVCVVGLWLGCGGGQKPAPEPRPEANELLHHVVKRRDAITSVISESVMDYWSGKERVKATVLMMGKRGGLIRFNALNPDAGSVAADMACANGMFRFVDYNRNCALAGKCDRRAIFALFRVSMEPDDFLQLASGLAPVLPAAKPSSDWDGDRGGERLRLRAGSTRQELLLSPTAQIWDIQSSTQWSGESVEWTLTHKDFSEVRTEDGEVFRLPEKSRFEQPKEKTDLVVRWKSRKLNPDIDNEKFDLELPKGLPRCS